MGRRQRRRKGREVVVEIGHRGKPREGGEGEQVVQAVMGGLQTRCSQYTTLPTPCLLLLASP